MVYIVSSGCNILFFSPAFPGCFKPLSVTFQRGFFFLLSSKSRKNIILFACLYVMYNWCKKNGTCEALVSGWQHQAVFPLIAMFSCQKKKKKKSPGKKSIWYCHFWDSHSSVVEDTVLGCGTASLGYWAFPFPETFIAKCHSILCHAC